MNEHRVPSNRETLSWFKDNLKNGKASEKMFKTEALSFFNLSPEMGAKDKRSFKREIEHFADMHQSLLRKWLREFLAENGGLGKNHDNPPSDFGLEIENDRKRAFLKFGRDGVKSWWKYQDWLEEECALFRESVKNSKGKKPVEDEEDHDEESNNQIRLLRERSSGKNIWDAEKITFSKCHDGSIRKSVIKETYAKVTIRKRHQTENNQKENGISDTCEIKRAKAVDNILNHTSQHDKHAKAGMLAKIIDREGSNFGEDILKKSKVMQETRKLSVESTAGLMTGGRGSEYLFRQVRTVLNKELGYNPLASQRQVDVYREKR